MQSPPVVEHPVWSPVGRVLQAVALAARNSASSRKPEARASPAKALAQHPIWPWGWSDNSVHESAVSKASQLLPRLWRNQLPPPAGPKRSGCVASDADAHLRRMRPLIPRCPDLARWLACWGARAGFMSGTYLVTAYADKDGESRRTGRTARTATDSKTTIKDPHEDLTASPKP